MSKSRKSRASYTFMLVLERTSARWEAIEEAVFAAGCDDATLGLRNGTIFLDFDRTSANFETAVLTAIHDVESAPIGLRVKRIEPDDWVTAAEIARRLAVSREAVRLWIEGKRGNGGFPAPRSGLSGNTVLWSWLEVSRWLVATKKLGDDAFVKTAEVIAAINRALETRTPSDLDRRSMRLRKALAS